MVENKGFKGHPFKQTSLVHAKHRITHNVVVELLFRAFKHAGGPASTDQDMASDTHQDLAIHVYLDDNSAPEREKNVTYRVLTAEPNIQRPA